MPRKPSMAKRTERTRVPLRRGDERVDVMDLDDLLGAAEQEAEDVTGVLPVAPLGPPPSRGRQPTIFERYAIKNWGDQDPARAAEYMAKRGIDPNFDEGFTWHDPTIDIAEDVGSAVAGGAGGVAGAITGGLPGAVAGASLGSGAARTGGKALANILRSELEPTWGSVGRSALTEGIGTAALGAGAQSGLLAKGLGTLATPVRWAADKASGIDPAIRGVLNQMTGRAGRAATLKELDAMPPLTTAPGAQMRPLSKLADPLMEETWAVAKAARDAAAKDLDKALRHRELAMPLSKAGLDANWWREIERSGVKGVDNMKRIVRELDLPDDIAGTSFGKAMTDSIQGKADAPISARGLRRIYEWLGQNRDWIGHQADVGRNKITNALMKRSRGALEKPWNQMGKTTQDLKWVRSQNKGEDALLHSNVPRMRPRPNVQPEARHNLFTDLGEAGAEGTPRIQGMADIRAVGA